MAGAGVVASSWGKSPLRAGETAPSLAFAAAGKEYRFDTGRCEARCGPAACRKGWGPSRTSARGRRLPGRSACCRLTGCSRPTPALARRPGIGQPGPLAGEPRGRSPLDCRSRAPAGDDGRISHRGGRHNRPEACRETPTGPPRILTVPGLVLSGVRANFRLRSRRGLEDSLKDKEVGKPLLVEATRADGYWQVFPRDDAAKRFYSDGRWKRPPHPVEWVVRQPWRLRSRFAVTLPADGRRPDGPGRRLFCLGHAVRQEAQSVGLPFALRPRH